MILRLDPASPDNGLLRKTAGIIAGSGVVVFPTETVYGLGADLRNTDAIRHVFRIKDRPEDQPLMLHCSKESQLAGIVAEISEPARLLIRIFWPGPLALVFKAKPGLPDLITGPNNTTGIRMVTHPVACALISQLGSPLAGTSANLHAEPPTGDFSALNPGLLDRVDVALDVGVCGKGTASTVLDVSCSPPVLLREGAVRKQAIERLLGLSLAAPNS